MTASELVRRSRLKAGLTQAELAQRRGTAQSAIARLERPGSNPRVDTLATALQATDHDLDIRARARAHNVDEGQILERLKLSPSERLATFQASSANMRGLLAKAGRPRAQTS